MGRPPRCRRVSHLPTITYFKPAGIPLRVLEEICLSVEEIEAIRLKDLEDLEQEQCAAKMNVSRPTFVRILDSARRKLAEALIKGKAVRIEGGNFEISLQLFKCNNGHQWEVAFEESGEKPPASCPVCGSTEISRISLQDAEFPIGGRCCQRGRRCQKGNRRLEDDTTATNAKAEG